MKVSILTPTYNRAELLEKLYTSLVINRNSNVEFEWLVMDDGSTDKTQALLENYVSQGIIDVKYYQQENQGKMKAINNLMEHVSGDVCFICDSDDYLATGAIDIIAQHSKRLLDDETVYALAFLKKTLGGKVSGKKFPENFHRSDIFSLYFREEIGGEKIFVFDTKIRKQYKHIVEDGEYFVTEARMYHKIDLDYDVICINEAIEVGDYRQDGYSHNITKVFLDNPKGYYMYFKEILDMDLAGVTFKKKLYIYKHYILFSVLSKRKGAIRNVTGVINKIIITFLWIPGKIATKKRFGKSA